MQISGTYDFPAPAARVWDLLMDTGAIAACVPGCQELAPIGGDRYKAKLSMAVSAVTGNFDATIAVEDKSPPSAYTLRVDAQGRPGFVKGASRITLTEVEGKTRVDVTADVQAGGAVARVGQRLLEGVGKTMMNRFFACLAGKLTART
jgi:carbon monoxide dehydrogenase subunit G